MWKLILKCLPTFCWIVGGTCLFPCIIRGVYHSCTHVFGVLNTSVFDHEQAIRRLSESILVGGISSIVGGLFWLVTLIHYVRISETTTIYGISIGGIVGVLYAGFDAEGMFKNIMRSPYWSLWWSIKGLMSGLAGGVAGGVAGGLIGFGVRNRHDVQHGIGQGMFLGLLTGMFFGLLIGDRVDRRIGKEVGGFVGGGTGIIAGMIGGGLAGWAVAKTFVGILVTLIVMAGGLAGGSALARYITKMIAQILPRAITPPLSLLRFSTILCNHCLRYTYPFKSQYNRGKRYCEHCKGRIEQTKKRGKVIVTFGNFSQAQCENMKSGERVFLLANPDFEKKTHPIEISTVWIDTETCDQRLLERFITYIVGFPPTHGLKSVQILYTGTVDALEENLKNALQNNFTHIEQIR